MFLIFYGSFASVLLVVMPNNLFLLQTGGLLCLLLGEGSWKDMVVAVAAGWLGATMAARGSCLLVALTR